MRLFGHEILFRKNSVKKITYFEGKILVEYDDFIYFIKNHTKLS